MAQNQNSRGLNFLNPRIKPARNSRRNFLKRAPLAAAAVVAATQAGCIILPRIGCAIGESYNPAVSSELDSRYFDSLLPIEPELPNLKQHIRFLKRNLDSLGSNNQIYVLSLINSWKTLTKFVNPAPLSYSSQFSDVQRLTTPILAGGGYGSGVQIDNQGHILTAAHVVEGCSIDHISLVNGISPTAMSVSTKLDIAVLKFDPVSLKELTSPRLYLNMHPRGTIFCHDVSMFGYPDLGNSNPHLVEINGSVNFHSDATGSFTYRGYSKSIFSGPRMFSERISFDEFVNYRGSSGGPVVNGSGKILGINSFMTYDKEGEGTVFVFARDTNALTIEVKRYMLEHLVGPIQEVVEAVLSEL
jgi:putative serine protease PepD